MASRKPSKERLGLDRGAVDEETFMAEFESVPKVTVYSAKDVTSELTQITTLLSNSSQEWDKKREALKKIRSLMIAGGTNYEEFFGNLKVLELSCQVCLKDLRSQLVRETCVTIAYMSTILGNRIDRFLEGVLQCLFDLIPNSAKIMSSSAIVCIRFLIQYSHSPRLVPLYCTNMSSKHRSTRRACCEFLDQLLHTWPTSCLEKHMRVIQEAIRKGITDADSEARSFARKAFWGFSEHFRDQADSMMCQLDVQKQKLLYGEVGACLSAYSSSSSLTSVGSHYSRHQYPSNQYPSNQYPSNQYPPNVAPLSRAHSGLTTTSYTRRPSVDSIPCPRPSSAMSGSLGINRLAQKGSRIPVYSPKQDTTDSSPLTRYRSAIDEGAAKRARARALILQSSMNQSMMRNQVRKVGSKEIDPQPSSLIQPLSSTSFNHHNNQKEELEQQPINNNHHSSIIFNNHKLPASSASSSGPSTSPSTSSSPSSASSTGGGGGGGRDGTGCGDGISCLDLLKPVMGELPHSQAAIKMLTKLVESQPKELVIELLPEMMPGLIKAYDSPEISVRKAAVFAMVTIHNVVGPESIQPFLANLGLSKMKLLQLYIERSKREKNGF